MEQIITRTEIINTPFVVIQTGGKHFGVMGEYKITEEFETHKEAEEAACSLNWKNLINIMIVINDYCKSLPGLKEAQTELNENLN